MNRPSQQLRYTPNAWTAALAWRGFSGAAETLADFNIQRIIEILHAKELSE